MVIDGGGGDDDDDDVWCKQHLHRLLADAAV